MASLDVEALLEETARDSSQQDSGNAATSNDGRPTRTENDADPRDGPRSRHDGRRNSDSRRSRDASRHRDRGSDRYRRSTPDLGTPRSDGSGRGRGRGGRGHGRSRSRTPDRYPPRYRDGDRYRSGRGRGPRSRSRSPHHRRHRDDRERRDYRDRGDRHANGKDGRGSRSPGEKPEKPNDDERDRRTVFCQQLAARLKSRELKEFFEKVGSVNDAQIVKDRISGRSKGVGYVEFKSEDTVQPALQLTGQKLLGIPIIVQLTEAEKNRQSRTTESSGHPNSVPFHRLYVGNIHFNVTEQDLQAVFEPFGELEFVQLQKDETGRSRGYGFVQFIDAGQAREALEKMNGFDLAGRPIRVGLGNDKFTPETTANLLQRFGGQGPGNFQGSAFSGAGGRGHQSSVFDKAGGRDSDKTGGASALDDTDVAGVNFNNYSRDALMRKLARTDETPSAPNNDRQVKPKTENKPLPVSVNTASRCVVLHNMFDPEEETGDNWVKELEDDVRGEAEQKYGHVVHINVDANSKGDIFLKFDKVQGGENAIKGLNGRFFGGRMINAAPVVDAVYSSMFARARAI